MQEATFTEYKVGEQCQTMISLLIISLLAQVIGTVMLIVTCTTAILNNISPVYYEAFLYGISLNAIGGILQLIRSRNPKREFTVLRTYVREDGTSGMLVRYKDGTEENRNI